MQGSRQLHNTSLHCAERIDCEINESWSQMMILLSGLLPDPELATATMGAAALLLLPDAVAAVHPLEHARSICRSHAS